MKQSRQSSFISTLCVFGIPCCRYHRYIDIKGQELDDQHNQSRILLKVFAVIVSGYSQPRLIQDYKQFHNWIVCCLQCHIPIERNKIQGWCNGADLCSIKYTIKQGIEVNIINCSFFFFAHSSKGDLYRRISLKLGETKRLADMVC
jgi:hypothetical protein